MLDYFKKTTAYLKNLDPSLSDPLDFKAKELIENPSAYEKASQALRRRFVRGALEVEAVDRGGRLTRIKREKIKGKYTYFILGANGNWYVPEERIWVVAMYALWQDFKRKS